jgi:hypothetical protein
MEFKELQSAAESKAKADMYLKECSEQPTEELDEYTYHNTMYYFKEKPKLFKIDYAGDNIITMSGAKPDEDADPKIKYNHCVREFVQEAAEAIKLAILKRNIIADKTYKLTLDQAASLGL